MFTILYYILLKIYLILKLYKYKINYINIYRLYGQYAQYYYNMIYI